jgi:hypothetical protein
VAKKKKKSRVPAPPKPVQASRRGVQAPQRRVEQREGRRTRIWFLALGALILVAAGAVGIAMAFRGGGEQASGVDGPCIRETFSSQGRLHVDKLSEGFEYNSFPPTSGQHYPPGPKAPVVWNLYETPLDEVALVHNIEHGGIVVQYGSEVPKQTVDQIVRWYSEDPNGIVVTPLPPVADIAAKPPADVDTKIFLTAWTHLATCSSARTLSRTFEMTIEGRRATRQRSSRSPPCSREASNRLTVARRRPSASVPAPAGCASPTATRGNC